MLAVLAGVAAPAAGAADRPDSVPSVDAPELAALGRYGVGVRSLNLIEQVPAAGRSGTPAGADEGASRALKVTIWYPARPAPGAKAAVYRGRFPAQEPHRWSSFRFTGLAVSDAPPDRGAAYPLVILSHGYSGAPEALSWLAENLASKGYVVAAPNHDDPPITDPSGFAEPLLLRPLDIAFVAHDLQSRAGAPGDFLHGLVDPSSVALAGYSMGGYGVLTVAGAGLSPAAAAASAGGALEAYLPGAKKAGSLRIDGLKAVVAISPAGGSGPFTAWDARGLQALRTPTFLVVGDQDHVVGFDPGVRTIFDGAEHAERYLLIFQNAGHSIGMDRAPEAMRQRLWDSDWFEDPVWRKARVIGVNLHMITAFLDLYVKGRSDREAYLRGPVLSNAGIWPQTVPPMAYDAFSPGPNGAVTVWKGFQRAHHAGLELHHRSPVPDPAPPLPARPVP